MRSGLEVPVIRRQLSLFLPEPERSLVDAVRARIDPEQHRIIPAHVTLCRADELADWLAVRELLGSLGPVRVELDLGPPTRLTDGCVLLPVTAGAESFDRLRAHLLGGSPRQMRPHVTLLHPRHARGREGAIDTLGEHELPTRLTLCEVVWIEQHEGGPWVVRATSGS